MPAVKWLRYGIALCGSIISDIRSNRNSAVHRVTLTAVGTLTRRWWARSTIVMSWPSAPRSIAVPRPATPAPEMRMRIGFAPSDDKTRFVVKLVIDVHSAVLAARVVGRKAGQIMATRKRHSAEQIVRKLMAADRLLAEGHDIAAVCRELNVSEATYHRWRSQFGGLKAEDAKRLKDLERENSTLKRLLADAELEKAALEGDRERKLLSPERRRAAVHHLQRVLGVSERFACRVTGQHRATQRHKAASTTPEDPDAALRSWLAPVRQGPSPAWVPAGLSRCPRRGMDCESQEDPTALARRGLAGAATAQTQTPRHLHRAGHRQSPKPPTGCGRWTSSSTSPPTDGRSRSCRSSMNIPANAWAGLVERSITGEHLIAELDRLAAERGTYPAVLRCDNGPELACSAMVDWAAGQVGLHFIPPGEPWRNGYVESFNARIRDECLNINSFWSLTQARVVISDWKPRQRSFIAASACRMSRRASRTRFGLRDLGYWPGSGPRHRRGSRGARPSSGNSKY